MLTLDLTVPADFNWAYDVVDAMVIRPMPRFGLVRWVARCRGSS